MTNKHAADDEAEEDFSKIHALHVTPLGDEGAPAVTARDGLLFRMMAAALAGDLETVRSAVVTARPLAAEAHGVIRHCEELISFAEFVALVLDGRIDDAASLT